MATSSSDIPSSTTATATAATPVAAVATGSPPQAASSSSHRRRSVLDQSRPRTLSSHQASLLSDLSKRSLNWHVNKPSEPNLVYLLKSVGTHSASNKILFCLFFKEQKYGKGVKPANAGAKKESKDGKEVKKNHTRIDLVEKEVVKKSVPLDHVVQVRQLPENPCTVELIYLLDVPEKKKKKKVVAGDDKPQAFQITFTFISLRDANDVCHLIHSIVAKTFSGFSFGQICLHKGVVEKQRRSKVSWVKRYLLLFNNRLLVYRTPDSLFPVNVYCLSGSGLSIVSAAEASAFTGATLPSRGISPPSSPGPTQPATTGRSPPKQTRTIAPADGKSPAKASSAGVPPALSGISGPLAAGVVVVDGETKYRMADLAQLGARRVDLVRFSIVNDNRSFAIEPMLNGAPIGKKFIFRADSVKEQQAWFTALQSEQDPKFDQPITSLTAKAQTMVSSTTGKAVGGAPGSALSGGRPGAVLIQRSALAASGATGGVPAKIAASWNTTANLSADALAALPSFGADEDEEDDDDDDSAYTGVAAETEASDDPDEDTRVLAKMSTPDMLVRLPKMNGNQRLYFAYMSRMRDKKIIFSSSLWTSDDWQKHTPQKLMSSRGKGMVVVDEALAVYHYTLQATNQLMKTFRIVCTETRSQSAASQIGFAFPGFDSQVFDVGRQAVVTPWQFFAGTDLMCYAVSDWEGALSSKCVAKELMQTSPDVSALYESNKMDEAKSVMKTAQVEVLHNIALASYFKAHGSSDDFRLKLVPGDVLSWANVLAQFNEALNRVHMEKWTNIAYVFNPPKETIQGLLDEQLVSLNPYFASGGPKGQPITKEVRALLLAPKQAPAKPAATSSGTKIIMRVLVDPIHFLGLLRFLLDQRIAALRPLESFAKQWLSKKSDIMAKKGTKKPNKRFRAVTELQVQVERELTDINGVLAMLPTAEQAADSSTPGATARIAKPSVGGKTETKQALPANVPSPSSSTTTISAAVPAPSSTSANVSSSGSNASSATSTTAGTALPVISTSLATGASQIASPTHTGTGFVINHDDSSDASSTSLSPSPATPPVTSSAPVTPSAASTPAPLPAATSGLTSPVATIRHGSAVGGVSLALSPLATPPSATTAPLHMRTPSTSLPSTASGMLHTRSPSGAPIGLPSMAALNASLAAGGGNGNVARIVVAPPSPSLSAMNSNASSATTVAALPAMTL